MDSSDIVARNLAEACWQDYLPLKEQAARILERRRHIEEQDLELNKLRDQHMSWISSQRYPQDLCDPVTGQQKRDPHWAVLDEIDGLRTRIRAAPRELCENALAWLRNCAKVLPEASIERFELQIDKNQIKQSCLTIRDEIDQQLRKYAGPTPENLPPGPRKDYDRSLLLSKDEIDAVKRKVQEMKEEADMLARPAAEQRQTIVSSRVVIEVQSHEEANAQENKKQKRRRVPDMERHCAIAKVVKPYGDDWHKLENLQKIAEELDCQEKATRPKRWAMGKPASRSWVDAVDNIPKKVFWVIRDSLKTVAQFPSISPNSP